MNTSQQTSVEPTPVTPVVLHGFSEEHRDVYMKGYLDSATTLLKICESVFAGSAGFHYVRERFAAKIVSEAELLNEIKMLQRN